MSRLRVAVEAETDMSEILDALETKASPAVAARYAERFRQAVERLVEMPRNGASKPALGPHARRVVVPPYILIYDYTSGDDMVTLLRVLHGRRRITAEMRQRG